MRVVISAPPAIDATDYAASLCAGRAPWRDPGRAMCERYGYQTLYEIPTQTQKRLRRELMRLHLDALHAGDDVVCDHSVFGWLADWMRWLWAETSSEEWDAVLEEARPAAELPEEIHHVSSGPRAAYDGYRWLDERNSVQVERLMRALYRDFGVEAKVRWIELPSVRAS